MKTILLERCLDDFASEFFGRTLPTFTKNYSILSNKKETDKDYQLEISVPGFTKEEIKIEIDNDILTISSEVKDETIFCKKSFEKQYSIPNDVNQDEISAKVENGILYLVLPKKEETTKKSIKIN